MRIYYDDLVKQNSDILNLNVFTQKDRVHSHSHVTVCLRLQRPSGRICLIQNVPIWCLTWTDSLILYLITARDGLFRDVF